jgi:hypothetical protein
LIQLSSSNLTLSGVGILLNGIHSVKCGIEYLGLKTVPVLRYHLLIFELIQQKKPFQCEHGSLVPENMANRMGITVIIIDIFQFFYLIVFQLKKSGER